MKRIASHQCSVSVSFDHWSFPGFGWDANFTFDCDATGVHMHSLHS